MKKTLFLLAIGGTVAFSGCSLKQMVKMAKDQDLAVNPSPLEVHADTVKFEMSAVLPTNMLKKGKVYSINTFYTSGADEVALPTALSFSRETYPNQSTEAPSTSVQQAFLYKEGMNPGELQVQGVASNPKNGKERKTDRMTVAPGLITTSKLVIADGGAAYGVGGEGGSMAAIADHGYNNQEELIPTNVEFFFEQGRSTLRNSEKSSERGKFFSAFVAEKNVTRSVTITGTHSPEGSERINSKLSEDRAAVIEKFYREQMAKYDYKGEADGINFILKPVVDDWTDFKNELASYDGISASEKSEILNIVNGAGSFDEKEKNLKKLSTYKTIFRDIYPKLRTAKTDILTVKEKKTDAEISALAKQIVAGQTDADALSAEEMAYAATLTPDLKEKADIYAALVKKTDSWVAHNNLGATHLEMALRGMDATANLSKAATHFETANRKKANAESTNNLGVVYLLQGNATKAYATLNSVASMNPSASTMRSNAAAKGVVEIMLGKYDAAVASLSKADETSVNLFNKGLAQLLKKDFQNASTSFNEAASKNSKLAIAHYGAAIASARLNQESKVYEHLTKAVARDAKLKDKAATDLEFRNYASTDGFKAAIR